MFSQFELDAMYRTKLYKIACNLGLDVTTKTKKGELIEKLLDCVVVEEEVLPPMSVRVRRIYESSKGE